VYGRSTEWDPRIGVAASLAGVAAGVLLIVLAWFLPNPATVPQGIMLVVVMLPLLVVSLRAAQRIPEGGDIVWILKPEEIEVRGLRGASRIRWEQCSHALFVYGWRPGSVALSLDLPWPDEEAQSTGMATGIAAGVAVTGAALQIFLDERTFDARGLHADLRRRIGEARDRAKRRRDESNGPR
jgi:hypothetical protein